MDDQNPVDTKSSAEPKEEVSARQVGRMDSPSFVDVWANDALVQHSPWDFQITFAMVKAVTKEQAVVHNVASVRMSPQFIKRVIRTMQKNVEAYERRYGPIAPPRGLTDNFDLEDEIVDARE
jgi:hypothetical protein